MMQSTALELFLQYFNNMRHIGKFSKQHTLGSTTCIAVERDQVMSLTGCVKDMYYYIIIIIKNNNNVWFY